MNHNNISILSDEFYSDVANFNWDFTTIWDWFLGFVSYQVSLHGIWAYVLIAVIILFILLHMDATKAFTSLIIAQLYRQTIATVVTGSAMVIAFVSIRVKDVLVSKTRQLFRMIGEMLKKKDP